MRRRVVITGLGAITPFGAGVEKLWQGLREGRSAIGGISHFNTDDFPCRIAAEAREIPSTDWGTSSGRVDRMARSAAEQAWQNAGLDSRKSLRCGLGLSLGWENGSGEIDTHDGRLSLLRDEEEYRRRFHLQGPVLSCYSACAAGTQLVEEAARLIRLGEADIFLAGASDSRIHPLGLWGYNRLGALTTDFNEEPQRASRPFDRHRSGFVMGEGSGFLVLEEREHALQRGAAIHAEILAAASTCDAYSVTAPKEDGEVAARSITRCLERAGVRPEELDYINAHGTSTPANDAAEVKTFEKALGASAGKIPIGSFKSMIGHLAMASGLVELIGTVCAINHSLIPPNLNLEQPEFDLHFAGSVSEECCLKKVLKTSFGFGGQNSSILLASPQA